MNDTIEPHQEEHDLDSKRHSSYLAAETTIHRSSRCRISRSSSSTTRTNVLRRADWFCVFIVIICGNIGVFEVVFGFVSSSSTRIRHHQQRHHHPESQLAVHPSFTSPRTGGNNHPQHHSFCFYERILLNSSPTLALAKGNIRYSELRMSMGSEDSDLIEDNDDLGGDDITANKDVPQQQENLEQQQQEVVVRYDDGGSDLTDRFKYKVNALMGKFDPTTGTDDEYQDGNIMNALMTFPQRYTFNVVGRISSSKDNDNDDDENDNDNNNAYVSDVKRLIYETTGDDNLVCTIKPRGTSFVKVQCETSVQSVAMINTIYDDLDTLEATVMRF